MLKAFSPPGGADCTSDTERAKARRAASTVRELLDNGATPLDCLQALAPSGDLGIRIPQAYGGTKESAVGHLALNEALATESGEVAFLVQQHTGATALILSAAPDVIKSTWLPAAAAGDILLCPAASHLRNARPGGDGMQVLHDDEGMSLRGGSPYVSGYGIMSHVLLAAADGDKPSAYFIAPFRPQAGMQITHLPPLSACQGTNTVAIHFHGYRPTQDQFIGRDHARYFDGENPAALASTCAFMLGLARRAVRLLETSDAGGAGANLAAEVASLSSRLYRTMMDMPAMEATLALSALVALRLRSGEVAMRGAMAAVAAAGGRSQIAPHPTCELLKEVAFFTVTTLSPKLKAAVVENLLSTPRGDDGAATRRLEDPIRC